MSNSLKILSHFSAENLKSADKKAIALINDAIALQSTNPN